MHSGSLTCLFTVVLDWMPSADTWYETVGLVMRSFGHRMLCDRPSKQETIRRLITTPCRWGECVTVAVPADEFDGRRVMRQVKLYPCWPVL